jgi:hypothetical protein
MLMLASQFARQYFTEGSRPSRSTLARWIERGDLPGRRIGSNHYVDVAQFRAVGDKLVLKVLRDESTAT